MTDQPHAAHGPGEHAHEHGAEHGHGHGSVFIQHHYDDAQHQFDSGKLGIWLFLAQEVLFFSALFVAYILYRYHHPEIYSYAHKYLDVKYGAINTAVLIFSSLTAAWAVRAAQLNQRKMLIGCIVLTLMCALAFLGIKYIEYSHKVHEHILFGRYFDPCVSSGGTPLLTKNNHCPGSKTTVEWDYGAASATAGCMMDIDQEPLREGMQAKCKVDEVKVEAKPARVLTASGSHDCATNPGVLIRGSGGTYTVTGACDAIMVLGDNNAVTFATSKKVAVKGTGNSVTGEAAGAFHGTVDTKRNIPKGLGAATVSLNEVADADLDPAKLYVREIGRKPIANECPDPLAAQDKKSYPCWRVAFQPAVCKRDVKQNKDSFGVLVEYGDHGHRGKDIKIDAKCDPTPTAPPVLDPLADQPPVVVLGEKALTPYQRPTSHEAHEREAAGPPPEHTNMFFTIYFAMTGLHGIHVLVGVFVFIWLLIRSIKGHFSPDYFGPVDFAALYWHIVDLIWIFLFPLLYLIH